MGNVISIQSPSERLFDLIEQRYAGFAVWKAFRLGYYDVVCRECLSGLNSKMSIPLACRSMELVAICSYYTSNYQDTIEIIERVSSLCPTHPICQIYLAESFVMIGKSKLAIELLIDAAEYNAGNPVLLTFISGSFVRLGFHKQALPHFRSH